jgi:hypothetical protein
MEWAVVGKTDERCQVEASGATTRSETYCGWRIKLPSELGSAPRVTARSEILGAKTYDGRQRMVGGKRRGSGSCGMPRFGYGRAEAGDLGDAAAQAAQQGSVLLLTLKKKKEERRNKE